MAASNNHSNQEPVITAFQLIRAILFLLAFSALIFLAAGTARWWQGWAYVVVVVGGAVIGRLIMARVHPDLIRERATYDDKSDVKDWDRWLMPAMSMIGPLAMLVVAGLDKRWGWSGGFALWVELAGLGLIIAGNVFGNWATIANRFFSAVVRIQTDRGHVVVENGPYRLMRHPGYAAGLAATIGTPVLLESWWAFIPAGLTAAITIARTALEDRALCEELPGYEEYTQRTRFRLLPGIW